jgi:hypothetical protein
MEVKMISRNPYFRFVLVFIGFLITTGSQLNLINIKSKRAIPSFGAGIVYASSPEDADDDNDGLTNGLEEILGTDPRDADTDEDGILDGGDPSILSDKILTLPQNIFKDSGVGLCTAMSEQLLNAEKSIQKGEIDKALKSLRQLRNRVDGCPPQADDNDWIVDCNQNIWIRDLIDILIANHFSYQIDNTVQPAMDSLPGLSGGEPRPLGVAVGPDGETESFIINEVVLKPANENELYEFLQKYDGTILRDGTVFRINNDTTADNSSVPFGWYLIRINPMISGLDDFAVNMEAAGIKGNWTFSSELAARVIALIAKEKDRQAEPNLILKLDNQCEVCEHPWAADIYFDAAKWWWMTEDDDPNTAGEQGLSIGVVHAWDYLRYKGYPPTEPHYPVRVAIIDEGFDLDETTGVPCNDNIDYYYLGDKPDQIDLVDGDYTAGGAAKDFPDSYSWHGQLSFGVCCAQPGNYYGTAGTSGTEARPIFIKVSSDLYTVAYAVYNATYNFADIINMSLSMKCGSLCDSFGDGNVLRAAVGTARNHDVIVFASAGNDGGDISDVDQYPCKLPGVICVGAIDENGNKQDYSNWGSDVDMWAPAGIKSTITRDSEDEAGTGVLFTFSGTSCSSPYLAGIGAMMKMLDSMIYYTEVKDIFQDTANKSNDTKVSTGYVDAFRAVEAVDPNDPPDVSINEPLNGDNVPYKNVYFKASVNDPELAQNPYANQFENQVTFYFLQNATRYPLCSAKDTGKSLGCSVAELPLGNHTIIAVATDAFGAQTTSYPKEISIVNRPPEVKILYPENGATFYTSQQINFRGRAYDPDDIDVNAQWRIENNDMLGTGENIWCSLPAGNHTITFEASDSKGVVITDTIAVTVLEGNGMPTAEIVSPVDHTMVLPGSPLTLVGKGFDPEDKELDGSTFVWTSSIDGYLGSGQSLSVTLSGTDDYDTNVEHLITLEVTDSDGNKAYHSITILVGIIG